MVELKIFGTEIDLGFGSLVHVVFGIVATIFGKELVFSLLFIVKQIIDLVGGENPNETSGDIAEYACGLVLGCLFRVFFF
jgi:Na+-driven multidrug efflux pump